MNKKFLTLLALIIVMALPAPAQTPAQNNRQAAERQKKIREVEKRLEVGVVLDFLRKCNAKIKNSLKTNTPLSSIKYFSYASSLKYWMKYRWFVADTGLSKDWLKKIYDLFIYMSKIQGYMETAKFNGQLKTEKFKQAEKYLDIAQQRFFEAIKKVVKVSAEVRRNAMKEKDVWQKAMRKKYNIKKEETWGISF
jgi:hypothetical protein